jgi:protein-S-isoprenylcysteine O-methyltransferase Ste14
VSPSLRTIRLRAVWLLVVPFLLLARPTPRLLVAGGALAAMGAMIRTWAAGVIHKERALATTGPYAHTRNPLYLGSFLIGTGTTVAGGRWELVLLFLIFFVAVYGRAMREEADLLAERFGEDHAEYARHVPLFVPRVAPWRDPNASRDARFTLERWRRNREYEALLALLAAFLLLAARMLRG